MSNITTTTTVAASKTYQEALYRNQIVFLLETEMTQSGNVAFILFKDGHEECVPLNQLHIVMTPHVSKETENGKLPENFQPRTNQHVAIVIDGERYFGSFTGRRCSDGGWLLYCKNRCGDVEYFSSKEGFVEL